MTPKTKPVYIGIDVAKHNVVIARAGVAGTQCLGNTSRALGDWLSTLPMNACLAVESTGRYHRLIAEAAHARGLAVYVLNPKDVRHYARALGRRGKTDRVDAELIARYLANEQSALHRFTPPSRAQALVSELLTRRAKLTTIKGMLKASLEGVAALNAEGVLREVEALLRRIDRALLAALKELPEGDRLHRRLCSIPGIGRLSAAALTGVLTRRAFRRGAALIAYSGLDPRPEDSGLKRGRRRLSKRGPAELRRLLYNAAMSAARTNVWKPFYARERAKGLSSTEAIVILARKLLRTAYALYRNEKDFDPNAVRGLT